MSTDFRQRHMKIVNLSAAALIVVALSGCSAAGSPTRRDDSPTGSARPSTNSAEGSTPMATTPAAEPTPPAAPSPRTGARGAPNPPAPQGADPEHPRDLVGPPMTITGTVTTAGGCTI